MVGRLGLSDVSPAVAGGEYPARAVVGEHVPIAATVFREGHDAVAANVRWSPPERGAASFVRMTPGAPGTDRWHGVVTADRPGLWSFVIEAWSHPLETWHHTVTVKIDAGQDVDELANDLEAGARLLERVVSRVEGAPAEPLSAATRALRDERLDLPARVAPALAEDVQAMLAANPLRELITRSRRHDIWVDRERALYGSWYEFFPRSIGAALSPDPATPTKPLRHGTLNDATRHLDYVASLGFDVVYLPPIHPIGRVNRKGPNNTLDPAPYDVGSPWAIGAAEGGHDAIHPELGTQADFVAFVVRTRELGMEVALDFALQAAPDHPWVTSHPEWFTTKPDGSIAYAENPPKKYQDIYPINFDNDPVGIYAECLRVLKKWIDLGVRIFRVDNPHTKPLNFWHWLIWEVKRSDPDVLFLAEAFTRPAMMHALARVGFTQSYTYFTWRNTKYEITEYAEQLVATAHYMRPNFFTNTPDILHGYLQHGAPAAFTIRAVLAATLSPTYGIYSGYELFEHVALREGSEEYLDTEKFQLRPRDLIGAQAAGRSLAPLLARLNIVRRRHPALQRLRNLHFHHAADDQVIVYSKRDEDTGDTVVVVCSLDPHHVRETVISLDLPALGLPWDARFTVRDELQHATYSWTQHDYVRLTPEHPAHVFVVGDVA
ncbi:MAG: alpha-1,4-glucan--maltose-1-phosphate maltosyltransferase [Actinomycetota bacterium]|nr:alpha-1,4-glucan--maltose-1-phosphate maltosyltransferase [Actinomycetota bacterium]